MANRVLLGKRGSDHGLFVSRSGVDVTDTSVTTPLSFDTNASASLLVHSFGQGVLVPVDPANASYSLGGVTYTADLGTSGATLGKATKVWTPFVQVSTDEVFTDEDEDDPGSTETFDGFMGLSAVAKSSSPFKIEIRNEMGVDRTITSLKTSGTDADGAICLYSYVIFTEPNFTNGESL